MSIITSPSVRNSDRTVIVYGVSTVLLIHGMITQAERCCAAYYQNLPILPLISPRNSALLGGASVGENLTKGPYDVSDFRVTIDCKCVIEPAEGCKEYSSGGFKMLGKLNMRIRNPRLC